MRSGLLGAQQGPLAEAGQVALLEGAHHLTCELKDYKLFLAPYMGFRTHFHTADAGGALVHVDGASGVQVAYASLGVGGEPVALGGVLAVAEAVVRVGNVGDDADRVADAGAGNMTHLQTWFE